MIDNSFALWEKLILVSRESPSTLEFDRPRDGVVVVRLNRPQRLNAINEAMQSELAQTLA